MSALKFRANIPKFVLIIISIFLQMHSWTGNTKNYLNFSHQILQQKRNLEMHYIEKITHAFLGTTTVEVAD